jgi:hypothetical protein
MRKPKYTEENLKSIIKNCKSIAQILRILNLKETGGNYQSIKAKIKLYNIDISHFTGQVWNKGVKTGGYEKNIRKLENILKKNTCYPSAKLKKRLVNQKILKDVCAICNLGPIWNNLPITLQLDHINGNRNDNTIENLRILCPNCHTQTPTHSGKNK